MPQVLQHLGGDLALILPHDQFLPLSSLTPLSLSLSVMMIVITDHARYVTGVHLLQTDPAVSSSVSQQRPVTGISSTRTAFLLCCVPISIVSVSAKCKYLDTYWASLRWLTSFPFIEFRSYSLVSSSRGLRQTGRVRDR